MKIACLIVDDEPNATRLLEEYVKQVPFLELRGICPDSDHALKAMETGDIDLLFLDINMPGLNGLDLANIVSQEAKIIFTTAYSEYAVESYEQRAIDYLLKPVSFKRFLVAVTKARDFFNHENSAVAVTNYAGQQESFFIKTGSEIVKIDFRDLKYVEASKEYVIMNTTKGKHICYKRMKEIAESLPENFVRVHHSFIVNIHHIGRIEANQIFMEEVCIPVSASYREMFLSVIRKLSI